MPSKQIARHLNQTEEEKSFTDFVRERPLDTTYRKLVRRALNAKRTRKAKKQ